MKSYQAIAQARDLLAGSIGVCPPTVVAPDPVPHAIAVSFSTRFVSQPVLDSADDELRHAELEYGRALPGLNCIWDKLEASLTHDLPREGEAVKATDDRAAARLREREGR